MTRVPVLYQVTILISSLHAHRWTRRPSQVKKKGAEKPKEYAELQAKYAKMQEMDVARFDALHEHSAEMFGLDPSSMTAFRGFYRVATPVIM